ncbi:MAG TPA: ABC transporter ATP-binding protein, partial [bacterium]|nr:ABC transporter ATP-binding protein [bacterium]
GKSTLMNILGCLCPPTSGEYRLESRSVAGMNSNQLADIRNLKIGFVFQGFNLLPRTSALDNTLLPLQYNRSGKHVNHRQKAEEVLRMVGLAERMDHEPSQLSGGQQQRVAIARALVNDPAIILADEPTGNLDTRTSLEIMNVFQTLNDAGITVIIVTHEPDIAAFTHRIIELRDGQIIRDEPIHPRSAAREVTA